MQIIYITSASINFWCPCCGVKNISEDNSKEEHIQPCSHYEGTLALGEFIEGDKNRIFAGAQDKLAEQADVPNENELTIIDILGRELDDTYVGFYVGAPAPNPQTGFHLYNTDWHITRYSPE